MVLGFDRAKWLSGTWLLKTDSSVTYCVKDGYLIRDGRKLAITSRGSNNLGQRVVSMSVDGCTISATLKDDELVWEAGEIWELDILEAAFEEAFRQAEMSQEMRQSLEKQTDRAAQVAARRTKEIGFGKEAQRKQEAKIAVKWTAAVCLENEETPVEFAKKVGTARRKHGRKGTCVPLETKVLSIFEKFDAKGVGKIKAKQLRRALQAIDAQTFTDEMCHRFFETLDADCNGEIEFAELCDFMYCRKDLSLDLLQASDQRDIQLARLHRLDGRYVHKDDANVREIIEKGCVLLGDGVWAPIKLNGTGGFTIGVDHMELGAKIIDEDLVWDDGDIWVLQGEHEIHEAVTLARRKSRDAGHGQNTQSKEAIKAAVQAAASLSQAARDGHHAFAKNVARARRISGEATDCIADPHKVVELFEKFDRKGSGQISFAELESTLRQVNPDLFTGQTCAKLFHRADANGNGEIDFEELIQWIYADSDGAIPLAVLSAASKHYMA